jgi:hypothetical protein
VRRDANSSGYKEEEEVVVGDGKMPKSGKGRVKWREAAAAGRGERRELAFHFPPSDAWGT